mgnify:CR=1 FL=1
MKSHYIAFNVGGMVNENCADTIKAALTKLNGVYEVITDINSKRVAIEYDEERIDDDILKEALEVAGYNAKR